MDIDSDSPRMKRRSSRRGRSVTRDRNDDEKVEEKEVEDSSTQESEEDEVLSKTKPRNSQVARLAGRPRKRKMRSRSGGMVKRRCIGKHRMLRHYDEAEGFPTANVYEQPLRRSSREKRLLFATFNVSQMDKQILNPVDISEDEMDPYEKLLSPHRVTRNSSRLRCKEPPSVVTTSTTKPTKPTKGESEPTKEESPEESPEEEKSGEGESEDQFEEGEEDGGYYNLRKRQPVIYHFQPVHHVVQDDTPPKKRRGRRRRRSLSRHRASYHSKARSAAPRAYQTCPTRRIGGQSPRKRQAHHDSSSTSSDSGSDSDEAKFRRRKARSMAKARSQCLPMNFTPEDLAQGVIRDRVRIGIGASLADVNPMNVDRSVTFDSIGGLKQHIRALKEMIIFPLLYPEVFERFQINPPRGVLFHGPPGCGKTLVARALANECSKGGKKVAFFMRKGADCLSKWVGESERQLRLLFDQAYQVRPSIIFFDEIDGLAPVRSSRQDQIHSSIVSTLLALMDGLDSRGEIVVIGATNRIDAIDPALRRPGRFDREFIFPLPAREDRHSILSIHTKTWNPRLKDVFLSELSNSTVGYCGADLRALCTEAALFALRRKYPQIYTTSEKLVLDTSKINVIASDFHNALKSIVPTAQRADGSIALALPEHVRPLYLQSLNQLLKLLCFIFTPSWKMVSKAGNGLESLLTAEKEAVRQMGLSLKALKCSLNIPGAVCLKSVSPASSRGSSRSDAVPLKKAKASLGKKRAGHSKRNSVEGVALPNHCSADSAVKDVHRNNKYPSINNWSGDVCTGTVTTNTQCRSPVGVACERQQHSWSTDSSTSRYALPTPLSSVELERCAAASSSAYNQLLLKHSVSSDVKNVFFDMTDVSSEDQMAGMPSFNNSIVVDQSTSADTEQCSNMQASCYLSFSSHPHAPPAVHHPRLVLCGQQGMGQSSYLGPAILHALEDIPVRTMDLATLCGSSSKTPEEACAQILRELRRVTPSMLFLPRVDTWWDVTTETFQATLNSALSSLLPSTPLLVLATAECQWEELPSRLKDIFADVGSQSFTLTVPSVDQRMRFFYNVLMEKPFQHPPSRPKLLSDISLEDLPVASPPKPRELNVEEVSRIVKQREAVLRELRVFLRDATNKLLAERKFKEFVKPVDPEEVPDYHDIICEPMDLSTVMKRIDEHQYTYPKQWIADVELIAKNALEYNPEHDSESRLLRHRAVALQDMAHSFLDHELSEEFEQQCEEIAECFGRIENTETYKTLQQQQQNAVLSSTPQKGDTTPPAGNKLDLSSAPRRSLRQKGIRAEGKGFPYYSPSKLKEGDVYFTGDNEDETEQVSRTSGDLPTSDTTPQPESDLEHTNGRRNLKNSSVRRQIIRPWEDPHCTPLLGPGSPSPGRCNGELSPPVQAATETHVVAMTTPMGQEEEPMSVDSDERVKKTSKSADVSKRKTSVMLSKDLSLCNGSSQGTSSRSSASSCSPTKQVMVDKKGLLEVFERIVKETEGCSVEDMERIHTTYQQLVFRHRMSWEREGLLEDLKLSTDLFLQELCK